MPAISATLPDTVRTPAYIDGAFDAGTWSQISPGQRKAVLLRFADLIADHAAELAQIDSTDAGKPISDHRPSTPPQRTHPRSAQACSQGQGTAVRPRGG